MRGFKSPTDSKPSADQAYSVQHLNEQIPPPCASTIYQPTRAPAEHSSRTISPEATPAMSLAEGATITSAQSLPHRPPTGSVSPERLGDAMLEAAENSSTGPSTADTKSKRRSLFGLRKKKSADTHEGPASPTDRTSRSSPVVSRDTSKLSSATRSMSPSSRNEFIVTSYPSSPGRAMSGSPQVSSPAGSQIFERNVQDYVSIPTSPAIPSHFQTENHIPPVLSASTEAIADDQLDPDCVEILTHSSHLPASVTVTGSAGAPHIAAYDQAAGSWTDEPADYAFPDRDDASNFTPLDSSATANAGDVRRLSFISFADVVQAEHCGGGGGGPGPRDSVYLAGLTSLSQLRRSPSPVRSPVSSQGPGTSPPTSKSGSVRGLDMSPSWKPLGSPALSQQHGLLGAGDINVETMTQALRRTGSADLGAAARSTPVSPIQGPSR